jgi:hypothetical protein
MRWWALAVLVLFAIGSAIAGAIARAASKAFPVVDGEETSLPW